MNEQHLARLEAQLERLIEGTFAQLFSKSVRAQDIALQLARAMEDNIEPASNGEPRSLAPDTYAIAMHPDVRQRLLERQPRLPESLSQHMVELATDSGYRLNAVPVIEIVPDHTLGTGDLRVSAYHSTKQDSATAIMQRIEPPSISTELARPHNPQLIINGQQTIALEEPIINLGRSRDNHITLDDPYISRYHAQIRLRFGCFTLFDTNSQTGTFVNDVRIKEHRLQPGDVIRLGKMQLVYMEDEPPGGAQTGIIAPLDG